MLFRNHKSGCSGHMSWVISFTFNWIMVPNKPIPFIYLSNTSSGQHGLAAVILLFLVALAAPQAKCQVLSTPCGDSKFDLHNWCILYRSRTPSSTYIQRNGATTATHTQANIVTNADGGSTLWYYAPTYLVHITHPVAYRNYDVHSLVHIKCSLCVHVHSLRRIITNITYMYIHMYTCAQCTRIQISCTEAYSQHLQHSW